MPLELITGPANAGVTTAIRSRVVDCARTCRRALVLVPSSPDVSRATRELSTQVTLGVEVRAFDHYLDGLWSALGDGREIITAAQRLVVLEESVKSGIQPSSPLVTSGGLVRTLARVVQRAAESPRARGTHDPGGIAAELLRCLDKYEALLDSAGFIERGEAHRLAVARAAEHESAALIALEGFSGLTRAQEQFLVQASARTLVVVGLTYSPDAPATWGGRALAERLAAIGEVRAQPARDDRAVPLELQRVERLLGAGGSATVAAEGALVVSEAWGEESEAARIIREVQDARAMGLQPGQIAVVYRDGATHLPALRAALDEACIQAEYDLRVPMRATGLGRALLLLLAACAPTGSYGQLLDVLRSRYGPGSERTLDELDAYARQHRARDVRAAEAWLRRHDPACASFLTDARAARKETGSTRSERRWFRVTSDMMRRAHHGRGVAEADLALDAAVARMFIEAVRSVNALGVESGAGEALAAALGDASVALTTNDRPDHVQVMAAERVRGRRFGCVILAGLTAGEFPRRTGEDALTAPTIALALERAGIDVTPRSDLSAERLLFYLAATRATDRLVLSWQSHDADGNPLRRSVFLDELMDLYVDPSTGEYYAGAPPHHVLGLQGAAECETGPDTTRRRLRTAAAADAAGPPLEEARRRAARRADTVSEAVKRATAGREVFSASEIESYLQCPFRWFVGHVVAPRELDDRLDAASMGTLAHEILRRFYDAFTARSGRERVTRDALELARSVHAEVAGALAASVEAASAAESAAIRAVIRRTRSVIEADADLLPGFVPQHREWSFGLDDENLAEPFGTFSLRGRVDRIDVGAGLLVVTDYKSSALDAGRGVARFACEGLVQLPLYAEVASRRLGLAVGGGVYRSIKGGKPRGFVLDALADTQFVRTDVLGAPEVSDMLADAVVRATEAVERMRAGEIAPAAPASACPVYCPARQFCAEWREGRA